MQTYTWAKCYEKVTCAALSVWNRGSDLLRKVREVLEASEQ